MTLGAVLDAIELTTPQPALAADFYARALRCETQPAGGNGLRCVAPQRVLALHEGAPNQLAQSRFRFADEAALRAYSGRFAGRAFARFEETGEPGPRLLLDDPEGRRLCFIAGPPAAPPPGDRAEARLQHYAVRTPDPERLARFYADELGFVVSDFVRDAAGVLRAAFLRTDHEHHALAIFHAPQVRFDHFSCETRDWERLRDWADHMAGERIALVWGVGRHGPGNDTFFMVADPDGNLAEISCDLESCPEDHEPGLWPHHPSTLNRWGMAIMRS
ncbi:VOC family protein [Variovorax sp. Varisp41]|uniref:VOC family protein n=1 Tax=Variovorax sp. Varisp41 TaxID=3243033 RepID=UPI0039B6D232